ncbi:hypothetical protein BC829DRAFT_446684 [Chytridium lagenaria]|nr:hypothetical protein BC829DRAFT_446684 [Chytridium lagenaria]
MSRRRHRAGIGKIGSYSTIVAKAKLWRKLREEGVGLISMGPGIDFDRSAIEGEDIEDVDSYIMPQRSELELRRAVVTQKTPMGVGWTENAQKRLLGTGLRVEYKAVEGVDVGCPDNGTFLEGIDLAGNLARLEEYRESKQGTVVESFVVELKHVLGEEVECIVEGGVGSNLEEEVEGILEEEMRHILAEAENSFGRNLAQVDEGNFESGQTAEMESIAWDVAQSSPAQSLAINLRHVLEKAVQGNLVQNQEASPPPYP